MDKIDPVNDSILLSIEKVIALIRSVRNDLISEFLKDDQLSNYYKAQFNKELTEVKKEFLKRDLKELLTLPVDLAHYAKLISRIRETNTAFISKKDNELFYQELDVIFKKYIY